MKNLLITYFIIAAFSLRAQNPDFTILKAINKNYMPTWDKGMKGVSFSAFIVPPVSIAGMWAQGYFNKDKAMMHNGCKSAVSIGLALATTSGLKYLFNRPRPYVRYPDDIVRRDFYNGPYSFPSGHTTLAFASATALSLSYKKWYVTVPSFAYAGLVGYSRMRLGVHYPSDVLGGIVIGVGSGFLTWFIDKRINGQQ